MTKVMRGHSYVDEGDLNYVERLGLAYCRLNQWGWDEVIGPKPDGFDTLPNSDVRPKFLRRLKPMPTKYDYITPAARGIKRIIGEINVSRCWWLFALGRTEEEWIRWYLSELMNKS